MMTRPPVLIALTALLAPVSAAAQELRPPPAPVRVELPAFGAPVPVIQLDPPRLPASVRAMIEEAARGDNQEAMAAVVKAALATQPWYGDDIKAMHRAYLERRAMLIAARTREETERIRNSGVLDLWTGQIEIGAYRYTGNTRNLGFSGALKLDRKGIDWQHTVQLRADYQDDAGNVSREQFGASYQPRYTLGDGIFTYGRLQFEKDEIQGFRHRYSFSGGLGYRVFKRGNASLALELGPALRHTAFLQAPDGMTWSALNSVDFEWKVSKTIRLTQNASAYVGSDNNSFTSLTGIEAGMAKGLRAKVSYSIEHETSPPQGALRTDTISRFSLVYGF